MRCRLTFGLLAAALLLTGCGPANVVPVGYTPVSDRVIALQVLGGVGDTVTAEVTDQTSSAVVVEVLLERDEDSNPDVEVTLTAKVSLSEPLSGRSVRDSSGAEIPRR